MTRDDSDEARWQAVATRDARRDGEFVYAVITTGVYCRPSCRSRRPRRENLSFHATPAAAEAAGYRACLRCRPRLSQPGHALAPKIARACRYLEEHAAEKPTLETLAAAVHVSPFHLQREFKALVGVSPKRYLDGCRERLLRQSLRDGHSVTEAVQSAGYGAPSRMYESSGRKLGMTPSQYRAGGAGLEISYAHADTVLGPCIIAATDRGLCNVQFGERDELLAQLQAEFPRARIVASAAEQSDQFRAWIDALNAALEDPRRAPELPLDMIGTAFQQRVWDFLRTTAAGDTLTYSELAAAIGRPSAARAVASACARNRIAVLIPCHRIVRSDGGLGGYRWGLERKRELLTRESGGRPN